MKEYVNCKIELVYLEEDVITASPIELPNDSIGGDVGGF